MKRPYEKPTVISEPIAVDVLRAQGQCCKSVNYYEFNTWGAGEEGCDTVCSCPGIIGSS